MYEKHFNYFLLIILSAFVCTGCTSQSATVIDTGDIERIRFDYQQLKTEYDKLQSDYQKLANDSQFYAEYYQHATEAITAGIIELTELGNNNATEIAKLRSYVTILRNIINDIITREYELERRETGINGEE